MSRKPASPPVAAIVLAGGSSTRMGRPKATLSLGEATFVASELLDLRAAGFHPLVLVSGPHATQTSNALPPEVEVAHLRNPAPARGQLSSLKLALGHLEERPEEPEVLGALVALVDHPAVQRKTLEILREAARPDRIVVPCFEGRRGHPVFFGRLLFEELLATPDTHGARAVVRHDPTRVVELSTDDRGITLDIDTPDDLRALRERMNQPGGASR